MEEGPGESGGLCRNGGHQEPECTHPSAQHVHFSLSLCSGEAFRVCRGGIAKLLAATLSWKEINQESPLMREVTE